MCLCLCLCLCLSCTRGLKFSILRGTIDKANESLSILRTPNPCSEIRTLATFDPPLALGRRQLEEVCKCCSASWHSGWNCFVCCVHYILKHTTTLHWDSWLKNSVSGCVVDCGNDWCYLIMSVNVRLCGSQADHKARRSSDRDLNPGTPKYEAGF
jgi:hypothetical protein